MTGNYKAGVTVLKRLFIQEPATFAAGKKRRYNPCAAYRPESATAGNADWEVCHALAVKTAPIIT